MVKFIIRVLVFASILFGILLAVKNLTPFYWGNKIIEEKINHIFSSDEFYDTFFIGSSKTYRHIDPIVFDELTNLNSYNLASSGMHYLESHFIADKFLKKYEYDGAINIFQQKMVPTGIAKRNLHSVRSKYYLDFKRLKMGLKYYWQKRDYKQIYYHIILFIENQFCIGTIKSKIKFSLREPRELDSLVKEQRGFYPLDQQLEIEENKSLEKRKRQYVKKLNRSKRNKKELEIKETSIEIKRIPLERAQIKSKNGNYTFYKINSTKLNPELYFDRGHLNTEGAYYFTNMVAKKFISLN